MIAVIQKVHFCRVLPLPSPRWWQVVCESWLFDTRLSKQVCRSRLGYDGSASRTMNAPVLTTAFNSAKISLRVFLYRDFGERIEDPRMFYCHQWSYRETRDYLSAIILKSHLTLQVILPARASLVTPSLIDDSARPKYYIVPGSIYLSFSLVDFKNGPEYVNRGIIKVFTPLIKKFSSFLFFFWGTHLLFFISFDNVHSSIPKYL